MFHSYLCRGYPFPDQADEIQKRLGALDATSALASGALQYLGEVSLMKTACEEQTWNGSLRLGTTLFQKKMLMTNEFVPKGSCQ